jgi:3'(2'), 5'-bisphosphate nucleotidase
MKISKVLQDQLLAAVDNAVHAALGVYASDDFGTQTKEDDSPVTLADLEVNRILTEALNRYTPNIPVVSEEANVPYEQRKDYDKFWIIDPIDGTKEFVKQTGEFTINLGLVVNQKPVFGIIAIPVTGEVFWGGQELESWGTDGVSAYKKISFVRRRRIVDGYAVRQFNTLQIKARELVYRHMTSPSPFTLDITCSKDHRHPNDWKFIEEVAKEHYIKLIPCGSTIKICRIAEGEADLYVRMSGINDWDLAAGHAIVEAAGGFVSTPDGKELVYNTEGQKLKPFLIHGADKLDWRKYSDPESWRAEKYAPLKVDENGAAAVEN